MAIAGIILAAPDSEIAALEAALGQREGILETQRAPAGNIGGLVVVVERPSAALQAELKALRNLPGVWDLHLAFADYEDDLDEEGHMGCPVHEPRRHGRATQKFGDVPDGELA